MPPKKRPSSRKPTVLSNKALLGNEFMSMMLGSVATVQDNMAGKLFEKFYKDLGALTDKAASDKCSSAQLKQIICGDLETTIVEMKTRQSLFPADASTSSQNNKPKKRSVAQKPDDDDMEIDGTEMNVKTLPINSQMTDAELEDIAIPKTLVRMQQMSISKQAVKSVPRNSDIYCATPKRKPSREGYDGVTPRNLFPVTPGREARTPVRATGTPSRGALTPSRGAVTLSRVALTPSREALTPSRAPRTPHRVIPFLDSEREQDLKQKHADDLRNRVLEEKREKARQEEMKRNAVKARKEEIEKERLQKFDEAKKKDRNAQIMKQQKLKSPTRFRLPPTTSQPPASRTNVARKVFEQEESAPTPGRGPAKKGRIEVAAIKGGTSEMVTVAQPTVRLSPSRDLPRSGNRPVKDEPMDCDEELTPPRRQSKPRAKAKRSQAHMSSSSNTDDAGSAANAASALQAEQERYLIQQAAEAKARAEEELRRKEKKEAERRAEAASRMKFEAEMLEVQKEKERLMEQRLREEEELKATLAKQAEKKAREEALGKKATPQVYEMTPPRKYKAISKDDYGLHDLNSDDETDQEDDPRKEVPAWADFAVVRENVRKQIENPPFGVDTFFGLVEKPNLKEIFVNIKEKRRGSSAVWKSSPSSASTRPVLDDISE